MNSQKLKQTKSRLLIVYSILALLSLASAGCVNGPLAGLIPNPPDAALCTNLGDHGWCRYSISNKSYFVRGTAWEKQVRSAVIMPPESWAAFKAWSEKVCHQVDCANGVGSWDKVVSDLDSHTLK